MRCLFYVSKEPGQPRGSYSIGGVFVSLYICVFIQRGRDIGRLNFRDLPTSIRSRELAISITGYFLSLLIYLEATPTALKNIDWKVYLLLVAGISCVLVVLLFCTETKGMSLGKINQLFDDEATDVKISDDRTKGGAETEVKSCTNF